MMGEYFLSSCITYLWQMKPQSEVSNPNVAHNLTKITVMDNCVKLESIEINCSVK